MQTFGLLQEQLTELRLSRTCDAAMRSRAREVPGVTLSYMAIGITMQGDEQC